MAIPRSIPLKNSLEEVKSLWQGRCQAGMKTSQAFEEDIPFAAEDSFQVCRYRDRRLFSPGLKVLKITPVDPGFRCQFELGQVLLQPQLSQILLEHKTTCSTKITPKHTLGCLKKRIFKVYAGIFFGNPACG